MGLLHKMLGIDKEISKINAAHINEIKALQLSVLQQQFTKTNIYPSWNIFKEIEAYRIFEDVNAVVGLLATKSAQIPFYAYDENGEDLPPNDKLVLFLKKFTLQEKIQMYTHLYLSGEVFMLKDKLEFGPNQGLKKLSFLHPSLVTVVVSDTFPAEVVSYTYYDMVTHRDIPLLKDDVIHIRYFNPSSNIHEAFRGLSPIKVLAKTLTRLKAGQDASVAQLQNGGVPGIVYEKDYDVAEFGRRKEDYINWRLNSDNTGSPYFAGGELGYLALGLTLVDMDVAELAKMDRKAICNVYHVSDRLFNNDATGSEVSDDNANKGLYLNAAIPNVTIVQDTFNNELVIEFKDKARVIEYDVSEVEVLQENMLEKANAIAALPTFIPNEVREQFNLDLSNDPNADKLFIKTGYQLAEDFNTVEPVMPPVI